MSEEERILLEEYCKFDGISFEDGIKYLKLFLNTREFEKPMYGGEETSSLVTISFQKERDHIYASGAYSLDSGENRYFMSKIYDKGNSIEIISVIDRLGVKENNHFVVLDRFKNKYRYTLYDFGSSMVDYKKNKFVLSEETFNKFINERTKKNGFTFRK